jgi:deoxyribodipyrimidine photo-lyase
MTMFPPTRAAALARLDAFIPRAGRAYANDRNRDLPGHHAVSTLSPYIRHRLLTEEEVIAATLRHHAAHEAEKFMSEVYWRAYWKGWLEMRPAVWRDYQRGLEAALNRLATESGLRREWEAACQGRTGIDGFDHWAQELVTTGYLHNHARIWFASIWIFTLRLPWELGADFFLRHLLDGDPASNTLSWRWVGGLHTPGKTYLATAENIARNTDGRFRPKGLATSAFALSATGIPAPAAAPTGDDWGRAGSTALILHEDDLDPDWLLTRIRPVATTVLTLPDARSPLAPAPHVAAFLDGAVADTATRAAEALGPLRRFDDTASLPQIVTWARETGAAEIITPYAPTGPVADLLTRLRPALAAENITLSRALRPYDARLWPHATHGFFRFRDAIRP